LAKLFGPNIFDFRRILEAKMTPRSQPEIVDKYSALAAPSNVGFLRVAGRVRIGRYSAYLTIKPARRLYGTFQADVRLLNDHRIDDLDDEKLTSAVTTIRSLTQCLDSIGSVSGILSPMISSDVPAAQIASAHPLSKLKDQDEQSILFCRFLCCDERRPVFYRRLVTETINFKARGLRTVGFFGAAVRRWTGSDTCICNIHLPVFFSFRPLTTPGGLA
jgi:hypothetical protein